MCCGVGGIYENSLYLLLMLAVNLKPLKKKVCFKTIDILGAGREGDKSKGLKARLHGKVVLVCSTISKETMGMKDPKNTLMLIRTSGCLLSGGENNLACSGWKTSNIGTDCLFVDEICG